MTGPIKPFPWHVSRVVCCVWGDKRIQPFDKSTVAHAFSNSPFPIPHFQAAGTGLCPPLTFANVKFLDLFYHRVFAHAVSITHKALYSLYAQWTAKPTSSLKSSVPSSDLPGEILHSILSRFTHGISSGFRVYIYQSSWSIFTLDSHRHDCLHWSSSTNSKFCEEVIFYTQHCIPATSIMPNT